MAYLALAFIVIPLIEALLLAQIGAAIGWANTIYMVIAAGVLGAWLFKLEGGRSWRKWQEALSLGQMPEEGVLGGVLLLIGGVLLITPGVFSDVLGLLLLIAPIRRALARRLGPWLMARFERRADEPFGGVRVVHFQVGSPGWIDPDEIDAVDGEGAHEAVVVGKQIAIKSARPPQVIDADFEVKGE